jgi:apolipoprotein N-acyltransferase
MKRELFRLLAWFAVFLIALACLAWLRVQVGYYVFAMAGTVTVSVIAVVAVSATIVAIRNQNKRN